MKCSALNVEFNGVRFDPLGSRSPPYERIRIKYGYPLEKVRFLLLSAIIFSLNFVFLKLKKYIKRQHIVSINVVVNRRCGC